MGPAAFIEGRLTFSNAIDLRQHPYQDAEKDIATSWEAGWTEAQQQRKAFESKAAHYSGTKRLLRETGAHWKRLGDWLNNVTGHIPLEQFLRCIGIRVGKALLWAFYILIIGTVFLRSLLDS